MIPLLRVLWSAFTTRPAAIAPSSPATFVVGPGGVVLAPVPLVRRVPCESCDRTRVQLDEANDYIEKLCAAMRAHGLRVEVFLGVDEVAAS